MWGRAEEGGVDDGHVEEVGEVSRVIVGQRKGDRDIDKRDKDRKEITWDCKRCCELEDKERQVWIDHAPRRSHGMHVWMLSPAE